MLKHPSVPTSDPAQQVEQAIEELRDEFNDFTYIVSHDLGTPLRAVVNFARLLKERQGNNLDDNGKHYLEFISKGGEKAQAMLNGLLAYSRLNTMAKPPELLNTMDVLEKCRFQLKDKIEYCGADIRIEGELPAITAEANQIVQLFLVLIDNALTYYRPGAPPEVTISANDDGDYWAFSVRDNGTGIPAANHDRIFELFKRLHTDEEIPGTGVGLALAKRIVQRHGGTIGIRKSDENGTEFCFTLPKLPPSSAFKPTETVYG